MNNFDYRIIIYLYNIRMLYKYTIFHQYNKHIFIYIYNILIFNYNIIYSIIIKLCFLNK